MPKSILQSKTKLGAVISGLAIAGGAIGAWMEGTLDATTALNTVAVGVGVILVGVGIRDAIEKN